MQNFIDSSAIEQAAELPVRDRLPRLHRLPHGRGELPAAAHRPLGLRQGRDRITVRSVDFDYTPEQLQLRKAVREFAEAEIAPHVMEWDEAQTFPARGRSASWASSATWARSSPRIYGGAGLGYIEYSIIIEELSRVDGSVGIIVAAHTSLCTNHIYKMGSGRAEAQVYPETGDGRVDRLLVADRARAGSDAAGTRTTAVLRRRHAGSLNGAKTFTHERALRRRLRGDGGDGPRGGAARDLGVRGGQGHARVPPRQEGKQARAARQRHRRGDLRELPAAARNSCSASRTTASSTA